VEDEPYCPDCYYGLPEEVRQAAEEAEAAAMAGEEGEALEVSSEEAIPTEVHELKTPEGCESCGKEVPEDKLQTAEGFAICQACLSSDAELAVHLARARHQKRLQRLRDELDE
jgi:formylmethanofuran dehydrogenase subunit E